MATGTRIRRNLQSGSLGAPLTTTDTTITFLNAPGFATLAAGEYAALTLSPGDNAGEIVHLTAYTSGATTGTIERGQEGTTAIAHADRAKWVHGSTVQDYPPTRKRLTIHRSAAVQALAAATWTAIIWDTATANPDGMWASASPANLVAPVAGDYILLAGYSLSGSAGSRRLISLRHNGGAIGTGTAGLSIGNYIRLPGTEDSEMFGVWLLEMAANDYVEVLAYSANAVNLKAFARMWSMQGYPVYGSTYAAEPYAGTLDVPRVVLSPSSASSEEGVGTPLLFFVIAPLSLGSQEFVGTPFVFGMATLQPSSAGSAEASGVPIIDNRLRPVGVASSEAFGIPALTAGLVNISPSGAYTVEVGPEPTVTIRSSDFIAPVSMASDEASGTTTLTPGLAVLVPVGGVSSEASGTPILGRIVAGELTVTGNVAKSAQQLQPTPTLTPLVPVTASKVHFTQRNRLQQNIQRTALLDQQKYWYVLLREYTTNVKTAGTFRTQYSGLDLDDRLYVNRRAEEFGRSRALVTAALNHDSALFGELMAQSSMETLSMTIAWVAGLIDCWASAEGISPTKKWQQVATMLARCDPEN